MPKTAAKKVIPGLKLIKHNAAGVNLPDDLTMPFKLEISCRAPEFMEFTFVALHGGSEEVVVRGETLAALQEFIEVNNFRTHPRLRHFTIIGPDGLVEHFKKS